MSPNNENDYLRYTGNKLPRFLRLSWTVFFLFAAYYLVKFMWPNLVEWLGKLK
jgi:hypothetical protein